MFTHFFREPMKSGRDRIPGFVPLSVRRPTGPGARSVTDRSQTVWNKATSWEERICTGHLQLIRRNRRNLVGAAKDFGKHLISSVQRHQLLNRTSNHPIDELSLTPMFEIQRHATIVVDGNALLLIAQN